MRHIIAKKDGLKPAFSDWYVNPASVKEILHSVKYFQIFNKLLLNKRVNYL